MASRGLHGTMEELAPHLQEHLHPDVPEEELVKKGAEGVARRLVKIARSAASSSPKRKRIESLIEKWADEYLRDRDLLESLSRI